MAKKKMGRSRPEFPAAYKLAVVEARLRGVDEADVASAFGVSGAAVAKWLKRYRDEGPIGLESRRSGARPTRKTSNPVKRERVVTLKKEHEAWGTRRIRDVLARFEALGVSEQEVRRILHDEGLIETPTPKVERAHAPRRFERAAPNQLWQSDIFTFRLRRAERLYVCVFMDDHSRFIVGHAMAHHQKSALVMEAFERGHATYGQPAEVLTDNGRQYTVWRGKTEFEEMLIRRGIHHIRSRPQHPQTLGKAERFWRTLWDEFLSRTVFAHTEDAQRRLEHYLRHYNFQRPHQSLDGHVPADRYFRVAAHVRAEIERAVTANELRLALEQPPRKPFYVVGQLGDQRLSISAGEQGLEVHVGETTQTISLKERSDGTTTARRFAQATEPTDTTMADDEGRPGLGREESRAAGLVGAVGREASVDRNRGDGDFSRFLLPARDEGVERDAAGAGAGRGWGSESGRGGAASPDQGARSESVASGAGAAASGAAALRAAQDDLGTGQDAPWPTNEDNVIDAGWAQRLALLDDDEATSEVDASAGEDDDDGAGGTGFDPDAGWHERGPLKWERKLAGADAPSDRLDEDFDGQGQTSYLYAGAGTAERSGAAPSLRRDHVGDRGAADRDGSSGLARDVAQPLPDDLASGDRGDHRDDDAQASGATSPTAEGSGTGSGERTTQGGAGSAEGTLGDDRSADERGGWDRFWAGAVAAITKQVEEETERGPRASDEATPSGDDDA